MKKEVLESTLSESRLARALLKSGYGHISVIGNQELGNSCAVFIEIDGTRIEQRYNLALASDHLEAANLIIMNLEPELKKVIPNLSYEWF